MKVKAGDKKTLDKKAVDEKIVPTSLKDIAEKVGVNVSTVSRALNDRGRISNEKKLEIKRIANELGYIPNESAQILAGKNARTIGLLLPEISSNYYARIAAVVENELQNKGYSIIIGQTNFIIENELEYIKLFAGKNVDGIITSALMSKEILFEASRYVNLKQVPIVHMEPIISANCDINNYNFIGCDIINIDNDYGVWLAVKHLSDLGHKRIGFISEYISSTIRLPSFINAALKCKLFTASTRSKYNFIKLGKERFEIGGYLRMKELLEEKDIPTGVFASYDNMALGAMTAILEKGLKIPEDISIVGFDNIREALFFPTPLTTISPPVEEIGKMAVQKLVEKIEKKSQINKGQEIILKPKLVVRKSTAIFIKS